MRRWLHQLLHHRARRRGREMRRGRALDQAHTAPNGDRVPLADPRVLELWRDWR